MQTSIGFETQGMTVFEAASLGTPAVVSDPDIAAELGSGFWPVAGRARSPRSPTTLRVAAADIAAGTAPVPDPSIRERFRQSSRTAAMVEVYERARVAERADASRERDDCCVGQESRATGRGGILRPIRQSFGTSRAARGGQGRRAQSVGTRRKPSLRRATIVRADGEGGRWRREQ